LSQAPHASDLSLRLRKPLHGRELVPEWPSDTSLACFGPDHAEEAHYLLEAAFAGTPDAIPDFQDWWAQLATDSEYDPDLCVLAVSKSGTAAGFAQCWTSGFVEDLAVARQWRRRGLGRCLLLEVFARFARRGMPHVDLKVRAGNIGALALYHSLGMTEV
jgi:ribosomal protein S18 acetylase RimI-like enzyme